MLKTFATILLAISMVAGTSTARAGMAGAGGGMSGAGGTNYGASTRGTSDTPTPPAKPITHKHKHLRKHAQ